MSEHIHDREFQMAILKKTKANGWTPEDWMFFWIVVAGIGWIGFVAMALWMNSLLNDLKEPRRRGGAERNFPEAWMAAGRRDAGMEHGAVAQGWAAAPLGAGIDAAVALHKEREE